MSTTGAGWDMATMRQWHAQLLAAFELLVYAFDEASKRDGTAPIEAALERNEVADGLRALVIRMVFALLAESRGQLPVDSAVYTEHLGIGALVTQLRSGARSGNAGYRRLVLLWRALFLGVQVDGLRVPALGGVLFDPERYPFLEGRLADEPVTTVPSIPDESLAEVLGLLTLVGGPYEKAFAFDYAVFDPHDFGTAFETLTGYSVIRLKSDAVRIEVRR